MIMDDRLLTSRSARVPKRVEDNNGPVLPVSLELTVDDIQAIARTDPIALRTFLLPSSSGVAASFTELLFRVVRRCKRGDQVHT